MLVIVSNGQILWFGFAVCSETEGIGAVLITLGMCIFQQTE